MVAHLNLSLRQSVGVKHDQALVSVMRNALSIGFDVFYSVHHDLMGVFVVSELLLLLSDIDSNLNSLANVTNSSVQFKCPLRLLWNVVSLTQ